MATIGLAYTDPTVLITIAVDRTSFALWHMVFNGTPGHVAALRRFLGSTPEEMLPAVMVHGVTTRSALAAFTVPPGAVIVFDSPDALSAVGIPVLDAHEPEPGRWEEKQLDIDELNRLLAEAPVARDLEQEPDPFEEEEIPEADDYGPRFNRRPGVSARVNGFKVERVRTLAAGETYSLTAPATLGPFTPKTEVPVEPAPEPEQEDDGCPCDWPTVTDSPIFAASEGTLGHLLHACVHDMTDVPDAVVVALVEWAIGVSAPADFVRSGRGPALLLGAPEDALAALGWWRDTARSNLVAWLLLHQEQLVTVPDDVVQDVEMVLALLPPSRRRWARPPHPPEGVVVPAG